jgi:hypothetical protein
MADESPPTLIDRIARAGSARIAIVGLARGAGRTTVIRSTLAGLGERGLTAGIASAGWRDEDLEAAGGPATLSLKLHEGTVVASTAAALARADAVLETLEEACYSTSVGPVHVSRVIKEGHVDLIGPGTGPELLKAVDAIRRHIDGPILVEGTLGRRGFSAPGVAERLVLAVGGGLAPSRERILPAVRYYLDLFGSPLAPDAARPLLERALAESRCILATREWSPLDSFHWQVRDNAPSLLARRDLSPASAVVPGTVTDETIVPLLREKMWIGFVVRDPMRSVLSPVYHAAWRRRGGGVSVIHRPEVLALAVNPVNPTGPDFDAEEILADLRAGVRDVSTHDVVRESEQPPRKKGWFRR